MPPRQLDTARERRKDEFYTQLTDIAKEMKTTTVTELSQMVTKHNFNTPSN